MSTTAYTKDEHASDLPPVRPFTDRDHPNARMLREAHESFQQGNFERLFEIFHEDMVWRVPGNNRLSGVFRGREEIQKNFATLAEVSDTYWAHPIDYFGSDNHVVLVAQVRATRGDKVLEEKEALIFRVEDGKLAECWHMGLDPQGWDEFFS
ncbi:MAG: nuclear transport factor 2 family protein [Parvularcula sp.]|jgi:ketosteroid isomerase-like protein|nr:nuclear transport factor 2 family protein [Parvularcula sp.]